jgi:exodeoxyribonuclease VII large subunit
MAAADLPFPLLTGLGHEQDSTLLDEIATRAFDTPSKLALHVEKTIINNAKQAIENMRFIRESIKQKIQQSQLRIQAEQQAIQLLSQQALAWQLNRVKNLAQQLERAAYTQIVQTSRAINDALHTVQQHSRMLLLENHAQLNTQFDYIKQQAGFQLKTQRLSLKHTYQPIAQSAQKTLELKRHALKQFILQVMGRDPTRILHQGYSLARTQQGKVIHTKAQALAAQSFDLMLPDKQTLSVKAQADTPNSP